MEFTLAHHKENEDRLVREAAVSGTPFMRDDKQSKDTIPMPTFARRPSTEFYNTGANTANIGTVIRQIPFSTITFGGENSIQHTSRYLF